MLNLELGELVSKSQSAKPVRRRGRPRIMGPSTPVQVQLSPSPSLPPATTETTQVPPPLDSRVKCPRCGTLNRPERETCNCCDLEFPRDPEAPKPAWWLPPDSKVRRIALQAIAMRIAGMEDSEIAVALGISEKSISPYVYRAGKNGWLDIDNPKARMEYQLMHKVVRNLDSLLDTEDPGVKERITVETAKGTLWKQFGEQQQAPVQQTVVAVRIEMPAGPTQTMREETTGGLPAYVIDVEGD